MTTPATEMKIQVEMIQRIAIDVYDVLSFDTRMYLGKVWRDIMDDWKVVNSGHPPTSYELEWKFGESIEQPPVTYMSNLME
jgi:hypothetical protein